MKLGTKSLLFGCHQFLLHPIFTLAGWIKLYGLPSPKEAICIVIHDWGYWGCPNMDGTEGERHPEYAARLCLKLNLGKDAADLCLLHSRFYARKHSGLPSKLCWADKYGIALMPTSLWVLLGRLSGEIEEYISNRKYEIYQEDEVSHKQYFNNYKQYFYHNMLPVIKGVIKGLNACNRKA